MAGVLVGSFCCKLGVGHTTTDVTVAQGHHAAAKSLQSCPTLCDPINGSPPGSPIPGILQARILAWVAMPSSRASCHPGIEPGSPAFQRDSYQLTHQGSPAWHCLSYLTFSFFLSFYVQPRIMYHQLSNIPSGPFTKHAPTKCPLWSSKCTL